MLIKRVKRRMATTALPSARLDISTLKLYAGMTTFTLLFTPTTIAAIAVLVVNTAEKRKHLPCSILEHLILLEWCREAILIAAVARVGIDSLMGLYFEKKISPGSFSLFGKRDGGRQQHPSGMCKFPLAVVAIAEQERGRSVHATKERALISVVESSIDR